MAVATRKRPVGRPATIDDPRSTILAKAALRFSQNGFAQTSLQDIAAEVGLSKAAVYHYFPTKQVIYEAIVVDLLRRLYEAVASSVDRTDGAVAKVRSAMIAHARFFEENYTEYVTLLHGFGGLSRKVSPEEVAIRDRHEMLVRRLLKNARDAGDLDIADIPTVARAVLSMINWMVRWYKPAGPKRAGTFAADFFDLLYNGMRKR